MKEKYSNVTERIADGFLELLAEKPFPDITITEITRKAQVARASFYRNFDSTNDVLNYVISSIVDRIYEIAKPVLDSNDRRKWREFIFRFIFLVNESENYYVLIRSQNIPMLLEKFIDSAMALVPNTMKGVINDKYDYIARFSMISGVLIRWKDTGMKETPEEMVDYLTDLVFLSNADSKTLYSNCLSAE